MRPEWQWERIIPGRSWTSGDVSKLFKNERPKAPGALKAGDPPPEATLLAREAIQNAWDAAHKLREELGSDPQFEITFDFRSFEGPEKERLAANLGLHQLADRLARVGDQLAIAEALGTTNCLVSGGGVGSLRCLVISEQAACGMYGPWADEKSKLHKALLSVGDANEDRSAGGSFGYGKAGLIGASAIRMVVAYTCFAARPDDPSVTRRLLGMAYWGPHTLDGTRFTGFGPFGAPDDRTEGAVPFENEAADHVAQSLGLEPRDPGQVEDLGTTMLVVEPTVDPEDLLAAVERSWWPALEDITQRFSVVIRTADGELLYPKPKQDPILAPFVDAYDLATTDGHQSPTRRRPTINRIDEFGQPGKLGLVCDLEGWSYPADPDSERSLIALMRDPRMVVEYLDAGRTAPFVRGVFIADESINEVLRSTEPKAHDAWQAGEDKPGRLAKKLIGRLKRRVGEVRKNLRPPRYSPESISLPHADRRMRRLMSGQGRKPRVPIAEKRDLSINIHYAQKATDDEHIELAGDVVICFSDHFEADQAEVEVTIAYRYLEDDRAGEHVDVAVDAPRGYREDRNRHNCFTGELLRDNKVRFEFFTNPYPAEWTGRLTVKADIVGGRGS